METYRYAIFDCDGTILNTLDDLRDSMNHVLEAHGFPTHSLDDIRKFVGNGIRKLCERAVPASESSNDKLIDEIFAEMTAYYNAHCKIKTAPYPGMVEAVKRLNENGFACAIVSNKIDPAVKELSAAYFPGVFAASLGDKEGLRKKPCPDMVIEAMKEIGASKENSIYIGDSDVDINTAKNSGIPCISVLWGFRDKEFLIEHGATKFAADADEMVEELLDFKPLAR